MRAYHTGYSPSFLSWISLFTDPLVPIEGISDQQIEGDDLIYLPPSEWAGTITPTQELSPPRSPHGELIPQSPACVSPRPDPQLSVRLSPQPGPSSASVAPAPDLDDTILALLGDAPKPETSFGDNIHKDVAARWQEILAKGLPKDVKEKLVSEYLIPANCDLLEPPILNPEAKAALSETLIKRDFSLLSKQKQTAAALAALAKVTEMLLNNNYSREKLLKPISDASRLLCDSHNLETKTRRSFIIASINYNLKGALVDTKRDKYLFGENLTDKLNAAKTIQKSGNTLRNQFRFQQTNTSRGNSNRSNKVNPKALHHKPASRIDAGQFRPAAGRAPPANRSQPPPPPRRPRSPPPTHPPHPAARMHYNRR